MHLGISSLAPESIVKGETSCFDAYKPNPVEAEVDGRSLQVSMCRIPLQNSIEDNPRTHLLAETGKNTQTIKWQMAILTSPWSCKSERLRRTEELERGLWKM